MIVAWQPIPVNTAKRLPRLQTWERRFHPWIARCRCVFQGILYAILAEFALDVLIGAAGAVTKRQPPGIIKLELMRWRVSPS